MRTLLVAIWLVLALAWANPSACRGATCRADVDPTGMIWGILSDDDLLPVRARFVVAGPGWKARLDPGKAVGVRSEEAEGVRRWSGKLPRDDRPAFHYAQTLRESGEHIEVALRIRAIRQAELDGVYLDIKVPADDFSGGSLELENAAGDVEAAELPAAGSKQKVASGKVRSLEFTAVDGRRLVFSLPDPCRVGVSAHPGWLMPHYRLLVTLHHGDMDKGQSVETSYSFLVAGKSDRSPARLRLNADQERYQLWGFGGNYCFWPRGQSVDHTLEHLRPVWARTQMFLMYWEPRNDNADPERIRWDAFEGRERRMWILRTEMNAARKMAERGIPFIISCWRVPDWMRVPESAAEGSRRPIAREAWPELVESICAYLIYLKQHYGAEPAMFSFNEPQLGRMPDPQHHREFNKLLARRMADLGLETGILAGDVSRPGGDKIEYAKPLLNDPEGRQYVRALAFHSWGGASPETYRGWSELARTHNLPLLCTEVGWHALAHHSKASRTMLYALRELETYQDLLLYARPQVLLEWEYGGSYPLLLEGESGLKPTARYWMLHQFANRTPRPAAALGTESDNRDVPFTAFRSERGDGPMAYALHIANLGADRDVTLEGLPPNLEELEASCVRIPEPNRASPTRLRPNGGTLQMRLPPLSLTTLSWKE